MEIEIIKEQYGNFATTDGEKIQVFENGMELAEGWGFEEYESGEITIEEINLLDFPNMGAGDEYEYDEKTYQHYCGSWGNFLVNVDADYTVYVIYKNGFPSGFYETEEEAEAALNNDDIFSIDGSFREVEKYEDFGQYCENVDAYIEWYIHGEFFENAKYAIIGINPTCYDTSLANLGNCDFDNIISIGGEEYVPIDGQNSIINTDGINQYAYFVFCLDESEKQANEAVFEHISDAIQYIKNQESEDATVGIIYKSCPDGSDDPFNQYDQIKFKNIKTGEGDCNEL